MHSPCELEDVCYPSPCLNFTIKNREGRRRFSSKKSVPADKIRGMYSNDLFISTKASLRECAPSYGFWGQLHHSQPSVRRVHAWLRRHLSRR